MVTSLCRTWYSIKLKNTAQLGMQSNVIIFSFIWAFLSIFYKVQFIMQIYFVEWLHKNLKCGHTFDFSCDAPKFEGIKPKTCLCWTQQYFSGGYGNYRWQNRCLVRWTNLKLRVESNLCNWSRNFTPLSQPVRLTPIATQWLFYFELSLAH